MGTTTTTTTFAMGLKEHYNRKLLEVARPVMVAEQFADKSKDIPLEEGSTVNFERYVPLDVIEDTLGEGSNPTEVELEITRIAATLGKYGNSVKITEEVQLTSFCQPLQNRVKELGFNMGQSVNRLYRKALASYLYPMRVDDDSTYRIRCTATGTPTTTTIADTNNLTQADHFWCDGTIVFTSGQNKGISAHITAFANSTGTITFSPALKEACDASDTFQVVVSTGITSTDVVTCSAVERVVAFLKSENAPTFDGQYYIGIMSPFVKYDFMQDSGWINAMHYGAPENLFKGEVGRWGGVRWIEDTDRWTENATDGTAYNSWDRGIGKYVAGGAVNHTPIFGKHAYAGIRLEGIKDKLIVKISGEQDTSNYINAYSIASWRIYFVAAVTNAMFGVTLMSGASSVV